jgi:FkbM family methyltransferase
VPATKRQRNRLLAQMYVPWRRAMGKRTVHRHVQGIDLYLPWSHMLPDYARMMPAYGQNLVQLAAGLKARSADPGPLEVIDVGANIGDSALQIVQAVDARVLCVEGDPYWAQYLHRNVDREQRIAVEEVLLTADEGEWGASNPVREGGTTRFVQDADGRTTAFGSVTAQALRDRQPDFDRARLVKSDTDGFEPVLVPAMAAAWQDRAPVLFFEFDPTLARAADSGDPNQVWTSLAELGYSQLAVWDNMGDPLGRLDITDAAKQAASLEPKPLELGYHFWDVAACRADDAAAVSVLDELVPEEFSVRGTWR